MSAAGFALGIDLGTSNTVAMLRWPDGRVKPLLFDSSPLLPSAVYAGADSDDLIVGRDALHLARFAPACLEPNPKRRIDEERVLLGEREIDVTALIAAVLRHVYTEAIRVTGGVRPTVALAHPAGWGPVRRLVLADAATAAKIGRVTFVPEPVAAAHYFTAVMGQQVPLASALVVYDFGAGTFDASVVRRAGAGFEVAAVDGLDDVGGVDIDAAIIDSLRAGSPSESAPAWERLTNPVTTVDARERLLLWEDVRNGKEMLSRAQAVNLRLPLLDDHIPLSRADFETIAGPLVERTVRTTGALIRHDRLEPDRIAGLFLVGGSSRIPLVAAALRRTVGVAPTVTEQPELVVAEGALHSLPVPSPQNAETEEMTSVPVPRAPQTLISVSSPPAPSSPVAAAPVSGSPVSPAPVPRSPAPHYAAATPPKQPVWPGPAAPAAAPVRRRGSAGVVVLAVLATAVLLVATGIATGVLRIPHLGGPSTSDSRPSAGTTPPAVVATGGPVVPAGWRQSVADPLSTPGRWSSIVDQGNASECALSGRLTAYRTGAGTYRCKGPASPYEDLAVEVDVRLNTTGACAGLWFRFSRSSVTGQEAGYLLAVCEGGYTLATHGVPDSARITDVWSHPAPIRIGATTRVGLLARGGTISVFQDGAQVGTLNETGFTAGRTALGIVVRAPADPTARFAVGFTNVAYWKPA